LWPEFRSPEHQFIWRRCSETSSWSCCSTLSPSLRGDQRSKEFPLVIGSRRTNSQRPLTSLTVVAELENLDCRGARIADGIESRRGLADAFTSPRVRLPGGSLSRIRACGSDGTGRQLVVIRQSPATLKAWYYSLRPSSDATAGEVDRDDSHVEADDH
jgi:hypothetical protein